MSVRIDSLNESVFVPRVPTHNFWLSLSPTLSMAFLRPPLHRGFCSTCQLCGLSLSLGGYGSWARREEERDWRRRRSGEVEVWVVWCLRGCNAGGIRWPGDGEGEGSAGKGESRRLRGLLGGSVVNFANGLEDSCVGERAAGEIVFLV